MHYQCTHTQISFLVKRNYCHFFLLLLFIFSLSISSLVTWYNRRFYHTRLTIINLTCTLYKIFAYYWCFQHYLSSKKQKIMIKFLVFFAVFTYKIETFSLLQSIPSTYIRKKSVTFFFAQIQTLTEGVRDRLRGQCQRCPDLPHNILLKACRNSGENIVYITGFNVLLKYPSHRKILATRSGGLHGSHSACSSVTRKNGNQQATNAPTKGKKLLYFIKIQF